MSSEKKTIACFGATGGCVGATLAHALKEGHYCSALARTPEKLRNLLTTEHEIPSSTINQYLTIYQGDCKDPDTIAKVLINPRDGGTLVDIILSGVGAYPTFQWSIKTPFPLTDPTICESTIGAIFKSLSNLAESPQHPITKDSAGRKPLLIVVSTAGCGRNRGIPLPIYFQYHYLLGGPLADKKRMEQVIFADKGTHVRDFVIMRPLFLTDGKATGNEALRMGWEWGLEADTGKTKEPGPAIGYYVSRRDVAAVTFSKVIVEGGWEGKCLYTTY
ncbi:hypothetical protein G7046_g7386 [Stylonectria norvegica]|nr:hypothetical protein G7046_g7386 [Stylonectria norvegica]